MTWPLIQCPKCKSREILGPRYVRYAMNFGEALRYVCGRCGYSEDHPTKDAT